MGFAMLNPSYALAMTCPPISSQTRPCFGHSRSEIRQPATLLHPGHARGKEITRPGDQSGQTCLTLIFFDQAGLGSAPGAISAASITRSMQPTKSLSGASVAIQGAPPFTLPLCSNFFGVFLPALSMSVQAVVTRAA